MKAKQKEIIMVIIRMEVVKKMLKNKYRVFFLVIAFSFLSFTNFVLAVNYGDGSYGNSLYSATTPGVTASPVSGTYTETKQVTLSTQPGNTIRYSFTSTPSSCSSGNLYTTPINVISSTTIYTLACDTYGNSTSNSFNYTINISVSGATASPVQGTYNNSQQVVLSSDNNNTIRYSFTSTPSSCSSGILYTTPINITSDTTIYTLTCDNYGNSTPNSFIYIIKVKSATSGITAQGIKNNLRNMGHPTTPLTKNLKQGMTSDEVKILQVFLNKKGYIVSSSGNGSLGNETNYFGEKTRQALMLFQKNNGLTPDGIVGPMMRGIINNTQKDETGDNLIIIKTPVTTPLTKNLKQGMTSDEVKLLQIFLNKKGYTISNSGSGSLGNETNYFGTKTKQALMLFQKNNGLTPDGIVGPMMRGIINKK
jgi:peptidoglycan hydrolase-like protein with peptidoglycan-binding domain